MQLSIKVNIGLKQLYKAKHVSHLDCIKFAVNLGRY